MLERKGRKGRRGAAPGPVGGNDFPRTPSIAARNGVRARGEVRWVTSERRELRNDAGGEEYGAGRKGCGAKAGRLGGRCPGCPVSAGVSFRTHLRWPTPVRPLPDSRNKGRDFKMFWRGERAESVIAKGGKNNPGTCHFRRSIGGAGKREDGRGSNVLTKQETVGPQQGCLFAFGRRADGSFVFPSIHRLRRADIFAHRILLQTIWPSFPLTPLSGAGRTMVGHGVRARQRTHA